MSIFILYVAFLLKFEADISAVGGLIIPSTELLEEPKSQPYFYCVIQAQPAL